MQCITSFRPIYLNTYILDRIWQVFLLKAVDISIVIIIIYKTHIYTDIFVKGIYCTITFIKIFTSGGVSIDHASRRRKNQTTLLKINESISSHCIIATDQNQHIEAV